LAAGPRMCSGRCVEWKQTANEPLVVPHTVLTEVCYLMQRRCGNKVEARFLRELAAMTVPSARRSVARAIRRRCAGPADLNRAPRHRQQRRAGRPPQRRRSSR
jgi:hypothetical protein